ncbi:hypothetical protein SAMN02983003_2478 [Devosia enhydra]|uniref:Signal transducing protein n=1 Tax=Devosia enhydra TaxID=665118 RepID=A0A1K2HYV2_9HYPH|nr:hypothetical protein [Devosia enhydra]SFZ85267.1 hypothetical protein SAMN02983003_2478 [Devosia enhydra]
MYETVAEIADPSQARVLITALKAHGFHPLEGGENGLPGLPGVYGPRGIAIAVPDAEASDARLLLADLIADMGGPETGGVVT